MKRVFCCCYQNARWDSVPEPLWTILRESELPFSYLCSGNCFAYAFFFFFFLKKTWGLLSSTMTEQVCTMCLGYFDCVINKLILIIAILLALCKCCVRICTCGVVPSSQFGNWGQMLFSTHKFLFWRMLRAISPGTCTHSLWCLHAQWLEEDVGCHGGKRAGCLSSLLDGPADYM